MCVQTSSYHRPPLRPLHCIPPSPWLASPTPRVYKKHPHCPFACPYLRPPDPIKVPTISSHKNVKSATSSFPLPPLPRPLPLPPPPLFGLMDRPPSKGFDSQRPPRRRVPTPSISENPHPSQPTPVSGSSGTPLPSIRHLDLPPPNTNQYIGPPDPSAYPHPHSFEHPPQSGPIRYGTQHTHQDSTKALETIEESDSDKHSSPPPKKRRKRQALSCTGQ